MNRNVLYGILTAIGIFIFVMFLVICVSNSEVSYEFKSYKGAEATWLFESSDKALKYCSEYADLKRSYSYYLDDFVKYKIERDKTPFAFSYPKVETPLPFEPKLMKDEK